MSDPLRANAVAACSACAEAHRRQLANAERGASLNYDAAQHAQALLEAAVGLLVEYGVVKDEQYGEDAVLQRMNEIRQREASHA